jgi:hypothetical protein
MRTAFACVGLVLLGLGFAPTAGRAEGAPSVLGAGSAQCDQWTSYRTRNQDVLVNVIVSWTLGYLSGVASRSRSHEVRHVQADATSVQAWLDTDCLAQPSRTIAEAATGFVANLSHLSAATKRKPAKAKSAARP